MEPTSFGPKSPVFSPKRLSIGLGAIALFVVLLFLLCGGGGGAGEQENMKFKEIVVERGTFQVNVSATGIVQPIDRVELKSKASGEIVELAVEEGDFVKKGSLIARLDQKDEKEQVAQAEADLDVATAELKQAERTFGRREKLFQSNLISEEERDQMQLALAVARGKMIQATTTLERAKERLAEAIVRAPIDGVILQKYVEEGQIIASGVSNVSGGTPIADIADMQFVHIEAGIDEIDIGKVRVGQEAVVVADAFPQLRFHGKIVRIAPEARIEQNVTRFDVVVQVENPKGVLKSGMNTTMEILIDRKEGVLLVPAFALQGESQGGRTGAGANANKSSVLLKEGDRFVRHDVELGPSNYQDVIVVSGLQEGDIIGVPMNSRLKEENEELENRIRSSRSFGTGSRQPPSR
jgi:HlyD family secretion protein